jgi:general secretion pathway protein G
MNARQQSPFPPKRKREPLRGFTLVELLVTILLIIVLASLVLRGAGIVKSRAEIARCKAELMAIQSAVAAYRKDENAVPSSSSNGALYRALTKGRVVYLDWPTSRIANGMLLDPWGRPYQYDSAHPDAAGESRSMLGLQRVVFTLRSFGPDGINNSEDDIDLGNTKSN